MTKNNFALGTIVRNKNTQQIGAVVFDLFIMESEDRVSVEYDGSPHTKQEETKMLEKLGKIEPRVNLQKCLDCIFFNGSCLRYTYGRVAMLFREGADRKKIPDRIYPHCQSFL